LQKLFYLFFEDKSRVNVKKNKIKKTKKNH
jgi:hypothetical protein